MAENKLLNVKVKSGTFYISSKEDQGEGWTKQEFKNPQNKEETLVRYHKKVSIEGKLNHLAIKEDKYQGKVLSIIVGGEDESYALTIPIMDTRGKVKTTNQYFNSLVGSLERLKRGEKITMFVNNKNKDKDDHLYRNIVTLDADGKLVKSNFSFSDVPKWERTETTNDFGETEVVWNASPTNKFYITKITEVVNNFNPDSSESQPEQPVKEQNTTNETTAPAKEKPADDLPF